MLLMLRRAMLVCHLRLMPCRHGAPLRLYDYAAGHYRFCRRFAALYADIDAAAATSLFALRRFYAMHMLAATPMPLLPLCLLPCCFPLFHDACFSFFAAPLQLRCREGDRHAHISTGIYGTTYR